jgi:hypothetical protein
MHIQSFYVYKIIVLWTLSIILCVYLKHTISELAFCLHFQVKGHLQLHKKKRIDNVQKTRIVLILLISIISRTGAAMCAAIVVA